MTSTLGQGTSHGLHGRCPDIVAPKVGASTDEVATGYARPDGSCVVVKNETGMGRNEVPKMRRPPATEQQRLIVNACLSHGVQAFWQTQGTLLVEKAGIAEIMPELLAAGVKVLGFEGFEMESTDIHPRIDLIFVSGSRPDVDPVVGIAEWADDIWVDIALED